MFIKSNIPSLQECKFYKKKHYITSCPAMCIKIAIDTLLKRCFRCRSQIFCTCCLRQCIHNGKAVSGVAGGKKKGGGKRCIMLLFLVNLHFTYGAAQGKISELLIPKYMLFNPIHITTINDLDAYQQVFYIIWEKVTI